MLQVFIAVNVNQVFLRVVSARSDDKSISISEAVVAFSAMRQSSWMGRHVKPFLCARAEGEERDENQRYTRTCATKERRSETRAVMHDASSVNGKWKVSNRSNHSITDARYAEIFIKGKTYRYYYVIQQRDF